MSKNPPTEFVVPQSSKATLTALVKRERELSNRQARELIERGGVQVEGVVVRDPVLRPPEGAVVSLGEAGARRARQISGPGFRSVHIDQAMLAIDKDSGLVVIPTGRDEDGDQPLVARVASALRIAGHRADPLWVVHRIDRATSGLVLIARSEAASRSLEAQFKKRSPRREYLAWTEGIPQERQGLLTHRLHENPYTHRVELNRSKTEGKEAILEYEVEAETEAPAPLRARVRVRLVTGRRNQIRVQFAGIGCPLIGDRWYANDGRQLEDVGLERAALHAWRLGFRHPTRDTPLTLEAPLPEDLSALDRRLFGDQGGTHGT